MLLWLSYHSKGCCVFHSFIEKSSINNYTVRECSCFLFKQKIKEILEMEKFYVYQVKGAFYSEKLPFMEFNTLEEAEEYANQLTAQCNGRYSFFAN